MKRVIDGRIYDTETATRICEVGCETGDFKGHTTALYKSPKGTFFLAGKGGPLSMWARSTEGGRGRSSGEGLRLVDAAEAADIVEAAGLDPDRMKAAGFPVEEG